MNTDAVSERAKVVAFGRAWVERKVESAFSTAHLALFLDAIERGEHLDDSQRQSSSLSPSEISKSAIDESILPPLEERMLIELSKTHGFK